MFLLSPGKLVVVVVVALMVLGPDKLPTVAKQVGGFWRDIRRLREKLESEVRGTFPDLPPADTLTRAVRSPLTLLDDLAGPHGAVNDPRTGDPTQTAVPAVDRAEATLPAADAARRAAADMRHPGMN